MRNGELLLRWQRFGLGLALNISALAAVGYRLLAKPQPELPELLSLAVGGWLALTLNFFWLLLLLSNAQRLEFWNDILAQLELTNSIEGEVNIFSSERYRKMYPLQPVGPFDELHRIVIACTLLWWFYIGVTIHMIMPK